MLQKLEETLIELIEKKYWEKLETIKLEVPPKKELWDYAFACFVLAKTTKLSPQVIAWELKEFIENTKVPLIERVETAGPYLNIYLDKHIYTQMFFENFFSGDVPYEIPLTKSPQSQSRDTFCSFPNNHKTVIVDYIGANVGKPLHIGHMCTPNIGQTLINLYRKLGYNVIGDSHIGDWGIIFGKLILAYKLWGDEKRLESDAINYLLELYVKISDRIDQELKVSKVFENFCPMILDLKEKISKFKPWYEPIPKIDWWQHRLFIYDKKLSHTILKEYFSENNPTENFKSLAKTLPDIFDEILFDGKVLNDTEQATRDEFKLLSEWNPESIALWESITRQSIDFMQLQLDRINVHPTYNIWESFYEGLSIPKMGNYPDLKYPMKEIVEELIDLKIATRNDDNSVGVEFEKLPSTILQKRDGTHGYLASDLATIKYRTDNAKSELIDDDGIDWANLEKIIYSVDVRQELHLQQVFDIARRAGWVDSVELFHASNGFISLKDGAMSTRTGKIIRLEALLDEAQERAKKIILEKRDDIAGEELEKLAKIIWIWAIKYGYLSKSRTTNVVFDWDEFMTFEGNSGPYIQYAYVRGKSILEQIKSEQNLISRLDLEPIFFEIPEEIELIKWLLDYKNVLIETSQKNFPHILAGYIYELTKLFNSFYSAVHIKNEPSEWKKQLRIMLVEIFCKTIKDGFWVLGIEVPEKM